MKTKITAESFNKMFPPLKMHTRNFRNCCEHVRQVASRTFHTVSVINLTFSGLFINVELEKLAKISKKLHIHS